jgi:hypothetical protein
MYISYYALLRRYTPPAGTESMPDINHVIRRDQSRTFTAEYLRPMRGSCRQFMIFGQFPGARPFGSITGPLAHTLSLLSS